MRFEEPISTDYTPPTPKAAPNWPPRFDIPDDAKHPRSFDVASSNDRGTIAGVGWYTVELPKHTT